MPFDKWELTNEERQKYIDALSEELTVLRAKAGISQGELANIIGISRQTYSFIEVGHKRMSWSTYLTLIFFYDNLIATRGLLRNIKAYPRELIVRMNEGRNPDQELLNQANKELNAILGELDDRARHAIKTMMLVEYARCNDISGKKVVKAFEGLDLTGAHPDVGVDAALRKIRKRRTRKKGKE